MYCTKCGKKSVDDNGLFCAYCGQPVAKESANYNKAHNQNSNVESSVATGVVWTIIFFCTHCILWSIACVMYITSDPLNSIWNVVITLFSFYIVFKLYKKTAWAFRTALWLSGVDALWLLVQCYSMNVNHWFLYIALVDAIAFIMLLVNRKHFGVSLKKSEKEEVKEEPLD